MNRKARFAPGLGSALVAVAAVVGFTASVASAADREMLVFVYQCSETDDQIAVKAATFPMTLAPADVGDPSVVCAGTHDGGAPCDVRAEDLREAIEDITSKCAIDTTTSLLTALCRDKRDDLIRTLYEVCLEFVPAQN
jgi:hypothetical protein